MPRATKPRPATAPASQGSSSTTSAARRPRKNVASATSTSDATVVTNEVVSTTPTQVDTEVDTEASDNSLQLAFTEFMGHLQQMSSQFSTLKLEFKTLEKRLNRELRAAQKGAAKRKRKAVNRQPSGFVKPTLISTELATFLGRPAGSEMARTEVTREINKYIRANSLQDKDNGRKIIPDGPLRSLLKLKKTDELTYFNLQKYMSPHFAKAGAPAPV